MSSTGSRADYFLSERDIAGVRSFALLLCHCRPHSLQKLRLRWFGTVVDAIETWYGRTNVPIGYQRGYQHGYRNTKDPYCDTAATYGEAVAKAFPHTLKRSSDAPDAAILYRRLLAAEPDHSVTIVSIGLLSNLRDLLDSGPDQYSMLDGETPVKRKVIEDLMLQPPRASGSRRTDSPATPGGSSKSEASHESTGTQRSSPNR